MPSNTTPSFGSSQFEGLTVSGPANASDFGGTVLRQTDGKFLVVGRVLNGQQVQTGVPGADGLVSRFNADGSLDTSFGTGGRVTLPASPDFTVRAALLQSDGKLLIAGGTIKSGVFYQFAVYRLNADGTLDTGFDGDGIASTIIGTRTDVARAMALQADGKIVVAGGTSSGLFDTSGSRDFALVRYNADGSLDTTFSGDGKASTPVGPSFDEATAVAVLSDGKILVAGRSAQDAGQSDSDIVLARYLADGSLDTTFGTAGFVTAALTSGDDLVGSMAVQGDGKIVVAGSVDAGRGDGSTVLVLLRYNADGTLDAGFNGDGQQRTPLGTVLDISYKVLLQPDGKILVCGLSFYDEGRNHGFLLRYNADGGLDASFGSNGVVYSPFDNPVDDSFQGIALQPDGKIVVTGFAGGGPESSYDTLVLRYNADGTLDTSFGTPPANSYVRYTLGSEPVLLAPHASVHDAELAALDGGLGDYGGASLTVARHGAANAADLVGVSGALTFGSGTTLLLHGTPVATLSAGGGSVTATFVPGTTQDRADEFLRSLTYLHADSADLHVNTGVQIDLSFSDGNTGAQGTGGALAALASSFITVEPLPVIRVDGELVNESAGVVHITVTLDHASTGTVTVDWKTADWLATAPADYVAASGTLSFAPGETSQTIVIGLVDDTQAEGLEGAFVLFGNAVGAQLGDMVGTFGIAANDAPAVALPSLAAAEAVAFEGDALEFIVTLSAPSAQTITVDYHTGTGTTSDQDFVQTSGTLVFAPGETTRIVNVQTLHDGFAESTESVNFILSGATNAGIGLAQITGYIVDDDSAQAAGVTLNGTDGNDILVGSPLPDTLLGFSGNDFLSGEGDGNNDSMAGGDGNDLYMVDSAGDIVTEAVGQGDDTIFSDLAAYTLPANVENLWLLPFEGNGQGHQLSGTGNELANQLTGNFGNNTLSGAAGDDTLFGAGGQDVLVGGAGNDLLDGGAITDRVNYTDLNVVSYQSSTAAVNVNLSGITGTGSTGSGTASDGLGGTDTLMNIDFVTGSDFGDTLTGSSALIFEQFEGRGGNDTIDGGAIEPISQSNSNRASYQAATAAVTVNLGTGIASDGQGGTDTLININHVRGSSFSDTLTGSNTTVLTEQFEGRGGNDTINGLGGTDMVRYDAAGAAVNVNLATGVASDGQGGTDTLLHIEGIRGSSFSDTLTGGNPANGSGGTDGFEFYIGNAGNDTISGGAGYDRVDYTTSTAGVVVTLGGSGQGVALDGLGGVDTLIGIEAVRGSAFDDLLTGDDSASFESFEGREGNDTIIGLGGSDRADYGSAPAGVVVHLQTVLPVGVSNADSASDLDGASDDTTTAIVLPIGKASDGYGGFDRLLGIEQVRGSAFDDLIVGDNGDNSLEGGAGNDTLLGGAGADTLHGGAGNDSLDGGVNDPALGYDWVNYSTLGAAVTVNLATGIAICPDGTDTLVRIEGVMGTAFADTLVGDGETNVLRGNLGNDTIDGGAGEDWADYSAASGGVTVSLAAGTSSGADGTDQLSNIERIRGSHFADQLTGDAGNNRLRGNRGDDTLDGGDGQDTADYYNATGPVVVNLVDGTASGADGNDTLISIEGALGSFTYGDLLQGDDGDNLLEGRGGDDSISGGAGNDTLNGGDGNDLLDGGTGIDVAVFDIAFQRGFYLRGAQPGELVIVGQGIDHLSSIEIVQFANRRFSLVRGGAAADTLAGGTDDDLIDGGEGNDDIDAGEGNDALYGDEGNDSLTGGTGDGADTLDGGTGNDTMAGGDGDDEYAVDSVDDVVVETDGAEVLEASLGVLAFSGLGGSIGGGIDKVVASINYTLGSFIENLELASGAGLLIGTGNELDNDLLGNESDNTLSGAAGNDTLHGAGGDDAIDGGEGTDSAAFTGNRADYVVTKVTGGYTVADQTAGRDGTDTVQNVERLVFADRTVDLTMGSRIAGVPAADLKTLEELYVGFFNRVPEAEGLGYWIGQLESGVTLASIADQFYDAGVQFGVYSADMTNPEFIQAVYANVLYRPTPGDTAPNEQEIGYWNDRLLGGQDSKGTMVLTMLHDVHAFFETDPVYGFVAASLNNKAAVANYYAVQQGLSMNVQQDNVEFGIALAALITPTDTTAAIAYIGVNEFSML